MACRAHDHLRATVLELPVVADVARKRVAAAGMSERIDVIDGDAMQAELPSGHDAFLVANLVHYWSPDENRELLQRVRRAAEPGARLLLADFWTDPTHTQPVIAALMAGEFAVHLRNGDVYSVEEVTDWLAGTGWRFVEHAVLAGPVSLVAAEAV
jgi:SAM-dependent methyltransferase